MVKLIVEVPQEFVDYIQSTDFKDKPYDLCLQCPFDRKTCDGPDSGTMTYERWAEYMSARAKRDSLTHAQIADAAYVSKATIDGAFSGRGKDMRHSTMRAITQAVTGRDKGRYPCHLAALLMEGKDLNIFQEDLYDEVENLKKQHERDVEELKAELKKEMEALKAAEQAKIEHLKGDVEHLRKENESQSETIHRLWAMLGVKDNDE